MLSVYSLKQSKQWDDIVRSFKEYDVYWLSGYSKGFQIHGDGEPLLFFFDDGKTRAINVVMKRDIAKDPHFTGIIKEGEYFDFSTPYGYGGWIIEGNDTDVLFNTYLSWIKKNGIISEFVRFHPLIKNHINALSFYEVSQLGNVVHMDISSEYGIWDNLDSKNRNVIRKAIKNNVKIYNSCDSTIYEKFRVIYNRTMDKDEASKYYYFEKEYYDSLLNDLPTNSRVFWAEKDDEIIAASIMLMANNRINYHLSGSLVQFRPLAPSNLLLYETAIWGNKNGYKTLYLGGGVGSGEDNLFKFKKAFSKNEYNHFYIGRKVFSEKGYELLIRIRDSITNPSFFPKYRG